MSFLGIDIAVKDIIDILLVTILMYESYKLLKGSGAAKVFGGIVAFIVVWFFSGFFNLDLLGGIMTRIMSIGAIALVVIFQEEIRVFFMRIGSRSNWQFLRKLMYGDEQSSGILDARLVPVIRACRNMSSTKTGALIIFTRSQSLVDISQTGERLDAVISSRLIENIFFKNTPLHDGALIVSDYKLRAAGCVLPVSHNMDIPKKLGLRHRAALGICEKSDAIAVIVSEETGGISYAIGNDIHVDVKPEELQTMLAEELLKTK